MPQPTYIELVNLVVKMGTELDVLQGRECGPETAGLRVGGAAACHFEDLRLTPVRGRVGQAGGRCRCD
jgi:hypothetical protein